LTWKHIRTRCASHKVICSLTSDRNRTKTSVCAQTYFPERVSTFTCRKNTKRYLPTLKRIRKMGDRAKREYVRKCDKEFLVCISECAKNVMRGNVPLTIRQMTELCRKRHEDVAADERQDSTENGFLTALLPPILSVLGSLLLQN